MYILPSAKEGPGLEMYPDRQLQPCQVQVQNGECLHTFPASAHHSRLSQVPEATDPGPAIAVCGHSNSALSLQHFTISANYWTVLLHNALYAFGKRLLLKSSA